MRKRILAFTLSVAMILGLAWQPAYAVGSGSSEGPAADHWFYNQLEPQAQKIYNALENAYKSGNLKNGMKSISLDGAIGSTAAAAYLTGNRSLFNNFSAAKDAFDLEHPEAWYFDSAQLTLIAEGTAASATASMGAGKSDSYYVMGVKDSADVEAKTSTLETTVKAIADAAGKKGSTYEQIKYVHDEVINSISYKYEFECKPGNEGFVRTAYALITGEGVCEGYVRSFQMILNELGIPCVPIHGTQTSGDPEAHMWCAVYIDDEKSTGWYAVDPTWDDPVVLSGARASSGRDGGERYDYFMVGNDVIASNWIPSGYVSTGTMEFSYPAIAPRSYGAGQIETNGLVVTYDDGLMEGTASTIYRISYNGDGLVAASRKGYYFLVKMYDINADGSADVIDEWYYPLHMLLAMGPSYEGYDRENLVGHGNKYYHDEPGYLVEVVSNCEYVEFAVTDVAPPAWKTPEELILEDGYYKGTEDHIIAQTGLIYNPNGGYEQRPWVKNVTPRQTEPTYVGATHTIHMEFTDPLFHPDAESIEKSAALGKVNEAETAKAESVGLDYTGTNYSWGVNGGLPHQFAVKPEPQNVRWYCAAHNEIHTKMAVIEAYGSECRLTALEFEFTPSMMWADDSVAYEFYLTGLVGAKSNKKPERTGMTFVFENESAVCTYRCVKRGGIDWNLWGQPQLLDDPNNLDFSKMIVEGTDGYKDSIEALYGNMNLDDYDINGRLLLVVEDAGADREKADTMSDLLESSMGVDLQKAVASALYEIDFARICGKTIVETGDSLRMQVGFPAGFDASSLSTTVFKVYHFIKNGAGEITGVEEIPVTVTPYGLVFQVSSFSPFAIVAEEGTPDSSRTAVLAVEGPGEIEIVGYEAGKMEVDGTVKLARGQTYTIRVIPKDGCAVDGITATGLAANHTIAYDAETGTFELSYDDIGSTNAIIGISLAAGSSGTVETVGVVSLCGHGNKTSNHDGVPATCTADGKAPTVTCDSCGQTISGGEIIKATGHVYEAGSNYHEPTCMEPGTALKCTVCGYVSQAPALEHEYFEGVCVRDGAAEPCTVTFDPNGGEIVSGSGTFTVNANSTLSKKSWPAAARSGCVFTGWRTAKDPEDPEGRPITSDLKITRSIVLYASWEDAGLSDEEGYEIILNANGGTLGGGVFSVRTGEDGKLTEMPGDPVRVGCDFIGWFTDPEGGTQITLNTVFTGNTTIYARWEARVCVITATASPSSGGTVSGDGSYKTGDTVTLTASPASGYSFSYWSEDGSTVSILSTYSFTAAFDRTLTAVFTRNSSSEGSGSTGNSGTVTKTEIDGDGTVTTTVADSKTGASTVTVTSPDGSVSVTETDAAGNISRRESFANGVKVSTNIPVNGSVSASVSIPAGMASASVTIQAPVTAGTVAVNSATGKIVMLSVPVDGGLKVVLDGSAGIILADRSRDFSDMPDSHWAADSVDFVTSHGLFYGTGDDTFSPDSNMTRAMLMTVLARLNGVDTDSGSTWDGPGMEWAVANGISDGTYPNSDIMREQLVTMLYRYAGSPEVNGADEAVSRYPDASEISDWAFQAMRWAVQNGIIQGSDDGYLYPGGNALRSEVSAIIERFCRNVAAG